MSDKKSLETAKDLVYQVYYGSYDWERAEGLMEQAAKEIRRLVAKLKSLRKQLAHEQQSHLNCMKEAQGEPVCTFTVVRNAHEVRFTIEPTKPMAMDDMRKLLKEHLGSDVLTGDDFNLIRAVERHHGIKE